MKYPISMLLALVLFSGCLTKSSYSQTTANLVAKNAGSIAKISPDDLNRQTAAMASQHAKESASIIPAGLGGFISTIIDAVGSGGGIGAIGTALFGGLSLFLNRKRKRTKAAAFDAAKEPDRDKAESILKEAKI